MTLLMMALMTTIKLVCAARSDTERWGGGGRCFLTVSPAVSASSDANLVGGEREIVNDDRSRSLLLLTRSHCSQLPATASRSTIISGRAKSAEALVSAFRASQDPIGRGTVFRTRIRYKNATKR